MTNFKVIFLSILIVICDSIITIGQQDSIKYKKKSGFDFEVGLIGGAVNYSLRLDNNNAVGIGGTVGYYNFLLTPNYFVKHRKTSF
ncbi:MAG: hypothetical protein B6D61_05845 [Bacteroidetes bacterium 4484_249]|nr:MAG: hypothetical protein B6D61_05845 [Bacteroidetes bacterium 4484_249]